MKKILFVLLIVMMMPLGKVYGQEPDELNFEDVAGCSFHAEYLPGREYQIVLSSYENVCFEQFQQIVQFINDTFSPSQGLIYEGPIYYLDGRSDKYNVLIWSQSAVSTQLSNYNSPSPVVGVIINQSNILLIIKTDVMGSTDEYFLAPYNLDRLTFGNNEIQMLNVYLIDETNLSTFQVRHHELEYVISFLYRNTY